jgi:hypothetical protein
MSHGWARLFSSLAGKMTYIREESKVIYKSKDGRQQKAFDALEWLAAIYVFSYT